MRQEMGENNHFSPKNKWMGNEWFFYFKKKVGKEHEF